MYCMWLQLHDFVFYVFENICVIIFLINDNKKYCLDFICLQLSAHALWNTLFASAGHRACALWAARINLTTINHRSDISTLEV